MKDQFTKKGLVHVGRGTYWVGFNMPGSITISPDQIQLRSWGRTYVFAREEIHQIRRFRALATLLQIVHNKARLSAFHCLLDTHARHSPVGASTIWLLSRPQDRPQNGLSGLDAVATPSPRDEGVGATS
jgi:hypothetical protein